MAITTITNEIKIVIGSWGSYNACNERALGSEWLDLADYEDWEEIEEALRKQGFKLQGIDEELFIQDIEPCQTFFRRKFGSKNLVKGELFLGLYGQYFFSQLFKWYTFICYHCLYQPKNKHPSQKFLKSRNFFQKVSGGVSGQSPDKKRQNP